MLNQKTTYFVLCLLSILAFVALFLFGGEIATYYNWGLATALYFPTLLLACLVLAVTFFILGWRAGTAVSTFSQAVPSRFKPWYLILIAIALIVIIRTIGLLFNSSYLAILLAAAAVSLLILGIVLSLVRVLTKK